MEKKIDWLKVLIWFIVLVFLAIIVNLALLYFGKPNLFDLVNGKTAKTNAMTEYVQIVDEKTVWTFRDNEFNDAIDGMVIKILSLEYLAGKGNLFLNMAKDENYLGDIKEIEIDDMTSKEEHLLIRCDYEDDLEEIVIPNFSKKITDLKLKLYGEDKNNLASFSINLSNKKVKQISSLKEAKEEFNEPEFKNFLSDLTLLRYYEDIENRSFIEDVNTEKVIFAGLYQTQSKLTDDGYEYYDSAFVHDIIKEIFGDSIEETIKVNKIMKYDKNLDAYRFLVTSNIPTKGKMIEIKDISVDDDIYKVRYTYYYPSPDSSEKPQEYEMTIELIKLNAWKYRPYQIISMEGRVLTEE